MCTLCTVHKWKLAVASKCVLCNEKGEYYNNNNKMSFRVLSTIKQCNNNSIHILIYTFMHICIENVKWNRSIHLLSSISGASFHRYTFFQFDKSMKWNLDIECWYEKNGVTLEWMHEHEHSAFWHEKNIAVSLMFLLPIFNFKIMSGIYVADMCYKHML